MAERQFQVVEEAPGARRDRTSGLSSGAPALPIEDAGRIMEDVIAKGDLGALTAEQRGRYYVEVCRSIGLNPLTRPFDYIEFDKKLTLYPNKSAAEQLRRIHKIETRIVSMEDDKGLYTVVVEAKSRNGQVETDLGIVDVTGLTRQLLANARMKAVSKAKRRVTLAMLGLPFIEDDELKSIRGARVVAVNPETGEILDPAALDGTGGQEGPVSTAKSLNATNGPPTPTPAPTPTRGATDAEVAKARREAEAAGLRKTIRSAFGLKPTDGDAFKEIVAELLRNRWWVEDTTALTAEQIAEVRRAFHRSGVDAAAVRAQLAIVAEEATTLDGVIALEGVYAAEGIADPFLLGALATRKARLEAEPAQG